VYDIQKVNTDDEINFYIDINDEEEKNREDYIKLRILYFIWVLGALYYQEDILGELVKCKSSKIYHINKNSCQTRHIRPLAEFQRLWPDMSDPSS
jgi:hypothetical protein